jgi:hypothetical protein
LAGSGTGNGSSGKGIAPGPVRLAPLFIRPWCTRSGASGASTSWRAHRSGQSPPGDRLRPAIHDFPAGANGKVLDADLRRHDGDLPAPCSGIGAGSTIPAARRAVTGMRAELEWRRAPNQRDTRIPREAGYILPAAQRADRYARGVGGAAACEIKDIAAARLSTIGQSFGPLI